MREQTKNRDVAKNQGEAALTWIAATPAIKNIMGI